MYGCLCHYRVRQGVTKQRTTLSMLKLYLCTHIVRTDGRTGRARLTDAWLIRYFFFIVFQFLFKLRIEKEMDWNKFQHSNKKQSKNKRYAWFALFAPDALIHSAAQSVSHRLSHCHFAFVIDRLVPQLVHVRVVVIAVYYYCRCCCCRCRCRCCTHLTTLEQGVCLHRIGIYRDSLAWPTPV